MKAHTRLYINESGELIEKTPKVRGIMIANKGSEILKEFVEKYGLSEKNGKIVQKMKAEPENKMAEEAPNKGLTIETKEGVRSSNPAKKRGRRGNK